MFLMSFLVFSLAQFVLIWLKKSFYLNVCNGVVLRWLMTINYMIGLQLLMNEYLTISNVAASNGGPAFNPKLAYLFLTYNLLSIIFCILHQNLKYIMNYHHRLFCYTPCLDRQ